jgi:hypothetical protein
MGLYFCVIFAPVPELFCTVSPACTAASPPFRPPSEMNEASKFGQGKNEKMTENGENELNHCEVEHQIFWGAETNQTNPFPHFCITPPISTMVKHTG